MVFTYAFGNLKLKRRFKDRKKTLKKVRIEIRSGSVYYR